MPWRLFRCLVAIHCHSLCCMYSSQILTSHVFWPNCKKKTKILSCLWILNPKPKSQPRCSLCSLIGQIDSIQSGSISLVIGLVLQYASLKLLYRYDWVISHDLLKMIKFIFRIIPIWRQRAHRTTTIWNIRQLLKLKRHSVRDWIPRGQIRQILVISPRPGPAYRPIRDLEDQQPRLVFNDQSLDCNRTSNHCLYKIDHFPVWRHDDVIKINKLQIISRIVPF